MQSLNELKQYKTDKFHDVCPVGCECGHGYVDKFYDRICKPLRFSAMAVLEIGIAQAQSHLLWHAYFETANIYGIDLNVEMSLDIPRLALFHGLDAYQASSVELFDRLEPSGFDLIIDDGPHTIEAQLFALKYYSQLVKRGGYVVIEDIIHPNELSCLAEIACDIGEVSLYKSNIKKLFPSGIYALVIRKHGT